VGLTISSCSADGGGAAVESRSVAARVAELRAQYRLPLSVATHFEKAAGADAATHVRAVLPAEARRVGRAANVALPVHVTDDVKLEDATSGLSIGFALGHVQNTYIETSDGLALYRGAFEGSDVLHRVHAEGTEDFVLFEQRPAREELRYSVDVSRIPGLRLVGNTLEFLDETGTPALRVSPPYVEDSTGRRHAARLSVTGCAYDTNPAGPWGRAVTRPGAKRCAVGVTWKDVSYPAMVDPEWGATGSMATERISHTASVLASGTVLVTGGYNGASYLASAELFAPGGNGGAGTFAATGSMSVARRDHTATVLASGLVLVAGGSSGSGSSSATAELFDPASNAGAGSFASTASMASGRSFHTASVLASGKVLVTGGYDGAAYLATAELFDPLGNGGAGSFVPTGLLSTARQSHTASVLPSGKVLVMGGCNSASCSSLSGPVLSSAELFDPDGNAGAGSFVATGPLAYARKFHTASVLASGTVFVDGGVTGLAVNPAEIFDPASNGGAGAFQFAAGPASNRASHTASVLPSGKVLLAGGYDGDASALATAELFDAAAFPNVLFSPAAPMAVTRYGHTASVLPSGKVLVVGGRKSIASAVHLASAELFGVGAMGEACMQDVDCGSTFCADGVCCDQACGAPCRTCQFGTGMCIFVRNAEDADTCAGTSFCDPTGSCRKQLAQSCGADTECMSGSCADGVCCNEGCAGSCTSCNQVDHLGTCMLAPAGFAGANPVCASSVCDGKQAGCPTPCTADAQCAPFTQYCANDGTCQPLKADGMACNPAADCKAPGCRECTSGFCVDGFCCNRACNGTCEACAATLKESASQNGTCGPVTGGTDPGNECDASGTPCGTDGQCDGAGSCRNTPYGTSCGSAPSCAESMATAGSICNGAGSCAPGFVSSCYPYACGSTACKTECARDSDCAPGNTCRWSVGVCVRAAASCDGGSSTDCASPPFFCTDDVDCVAPSVCNERGKCARSRADPDTSSGCAVVGPRTTDARAPLAWLVAALALALARRRVRRAPR
jgi:hypothetical protein